MAIGKPSTPTLTGTYYIIDKEYNPAWYPPRTGRVVPSGPDNPLGYRWMGFLPTYGIHGTNAPWSIGGVVSNGCVRMHEEDVEELFEVVPYGTPVRITYERVKVRVDNRGQVSIGVYPDVYGYHDVTLAEVKSELVAMGVAGAASDDFLLQLIREEADRQVVVAQTYTLKLNDKVLLERAMLIQGTLYIPVWVVASELKVNVVWDSQKHTVTVGKSTVPGVVRGDVIYVTTEGAQVLFGGQGVRNDDDLSYEIKLPTVMVNGKVLTRDVQVVNSVLAIPAVNLSDALGKKVTWDAAHTSLMVQGKSIPVEIIDGQPYIQITKVYDNLGAYVYWNQEANTIDLTYPFTP